MKELTREEKIAGYKYALKKIKYNEPDSGANDGPGVSPYICDNLFYYIEDILGRDEPENILFPEFNKSKLDVHPDAEDLDNLGWWPMTPKGKKKRIKILEEIIKKLEDG